MSLDLLGETARCAICGRSLLADEERLCVPCIKLGQKSRKPVERVSIRDARRPGERRYLAWPVEGGKR